MRNFILLFFSVFTLSTSCSVISTMSSDTTYQKTTAELMIEDKSKNYPYLNVDFGAFLVVNAPLQSGVVATTELLNAYHKITVKEKQYMFRNLDLVRFAVNTVEFEMELSESKFRASRSGSGPNGDIVYGSVYDNERIMQLLRNRKYKLSIHKDRITQNALAVGVLGEFLYVLDDNDPRMTNSYWIAFPNHDIWDRGSYASEDNMAGIVFHEMMHNTGFAHGIEMDSDTVYGLQKVLNRVLRRPFKEKYASELESFRPFYSEKYKGWLKNDTLSYVKSLNSEDLENNIDEKSIYDNSTYCVIHKDNTHTMYTNVRMSTVLSNGVIR